MEKLIWVLYLIILLVLACGAWLLVRNNKVHAFLTGLVGIAYNYDIKRIDADIDEPHILSRIESEIIPNYDKMVWSFKKLSYENYLTGEEMEKLGLNKTEI